MTQSVFISTTIPYANARPHIGHAFEYVQTDAIARRLAKEGRDVYFLTGSDENSLKNVLAAERAGLTTQELVDQNVEHFVTLADQLELDIDRFIRTSVDDDHLDGAAEIWRRIAEAGDIYEKAYEGLYCVGCEQFYSPAELVGGVCPDHLTEPDLVREKNYFFRLSRYTERLLAALDSGEITVHPESRKNEIVSFVRAGLADISISRSTERARGWGIPVPGDDSQVMYVWIDALTNYVNALGWTRDADEYRRYWSEADRRIHVMGKGVIRFHSVYWPAMLMSAGLPVPTDVLAHGYLTVEGRKISKSLGNVTDPAELVERFGVDAVRYFLLAEFSPFGDGDYSDERLISRYNTDLANGMGNLVSRATSMVLRYRGGVVPASVLSGTPEHELAEQVRASTAAVGEAMARFDHREALARIWDLVRRTNAYVDERAPWHLAAAADSGDTTAEDALSTTLHHLVGAVLRIGILVEPFMPRASRLTLAAVGAAADVEATDRWLDGVAELRVVKPEPLFPRLTA